MYIYIWKPLFCLLLRLFISLSVVAVATAATAAITAVVDTVTVAVAHHLVFVHDKLF